MGRREEVGRAIVGDLQAKAERFFVQIPSVSRGDADSEREEDARSEVSSQLHPGMTSMPVRERIEKLLSRGFTWRKELGR
jgi:hypothetical protein